MTVLGIETSTAVCSVGIAGDDGNRAERSIVEARIHSEKLLGLVREVCGETGTRLDGLDGIAVSVGPGSFTGLRIGLSSAKGFCAALSKPIVAVPTFEAIAASLFATEPGILATAVILDARQGDWYMGWYDRRDPLPALREPLSVRPLAAGLVPGDIRVVVSDAADRVANVTGRVCRDVHPLCSGATVAELGRRRLAMGQTSDLVTLEPAYLKDFVVRSASPAAR